MHEQSKHSHKNPVRNQRVGRTVPLSRWCFPEVESQSVLFIVPWSRQLSPGHQRQGRATCGKQNMRRNQESMCANVYVVTVTGEQQR